ncbi:MAG: tRNA (guanosine(46)-N7)-methyltransferase TrmB [Oscillospiraceae bacterium]|nr:tRNA (guanosine(46)-N7)-methyltransferase TrmB [Oscillospiraceae bacterium]
MRMRRKPNLDARMDRCANLLISTPESLRGRWLELSELPYGELHIELGCGKGLFTAEMAKQSPEALFIGLEKVKNVIVIALERVERECLQNVRFINNLADDLTSFFAPGEVSRIYLNFSDPWPSQRHAKRRLTSQSFLESYKNVLSRDGEIHFKTDNIPLFEFSLREFQRAGLTVLQENRNLHRNGPAGVMTDYEMKFHGEGIAINMCIVGRPLAPMPSLPGVNLHGLF